MEPVKTFTSRFVALPITDIDTDQIIPARYLKTTDKAGLAEGLFSGWRYNADGSLNEEFVLNRPDVKGAQVLVAGDNFGCGSSREHAPWALVGYGFKAVISTHFADIFKNNSLKNGLLPIQVDQETYHQLVSIFDEEPSTELVIDLANQAVVLPGGQTIKFPIDPFAKHCLLNGVDQLGFLQSEEDSIVAYETANPARVNTSLVSQ